MKEEEAVKEILLDDIVIGRNAGAAAYRDIVLLPDGTFSKISEGTAITGVKAIAGKDTGKPIKAIDHLVSKYGGSKADWQKVSGDGYVDDLGLSRPCELHWYQSVDGIRVDMKVKKFYYYR